MPEERRGILGQGSVLMQTAVADRTSPVQRGKWIMEVLLGSPPPPPPQNPPPPQLEETKAVTAGGKPLSTRERMEEHRKNPACTSCHKVIDPLGLALENFDTIGAWRIKDNGVGIDTKGTLYDGTPIDGPASLRQALLGKSETVIRNFTDNLMSFALGRRIEYYDQPTVRSDHEESGAERLPLLVIRSRHREQPGVPDEHGRSRHHYCRRPVNPASREGIYEVGMYITKQHISRRTVLKGMGVTVALPILDAMVPAGTAWAKTEAAASSSKVRLVAMEMVHGSAGSTAIGVQKHLFAPAQIGQDFEFSPTLEPLAPFKDDVTIISNTDVRNAEAFTLPEIGGDHFRSSSAVFLTQSHPKQTEGNDVHAGISLDQLYASEVRTGHADPLDAALDRERRPGRRLHLRLLLHLHRYDQLVGPGYSRCRWSATRAWSSISCSASARRPRSAWPTVTPIGASSTGSPPGIGQLQTRSRRQRPARGSANISRTSARSSAAFNGSKRATPAASRASCPKRRSGCPTRSKSTCTS